MPARVSFITIETLLEMMENKDIFKLVEVLSEEDYAKGHIPGAVNIPTDQIAERAPKELPDKNEAIVTYCASYKCHASTEAARKLTDMGYTKVLDYKASKKGWEAAGMPLQK